MVRVTGLAPVSASDSAAVLKTAVFAFHHTRRQTDGERRTLPVLLWWATRLCHATRLAGELVRSSAVTW